MIKGKALRRAMLCTDAARVMENIPLITDTTELITPQKAHELLRQNKYNRPTNWRRVEEYTDIMSRGDWKLTPQGIILDSEGNLLNGQNRLWAVVYSGASVHMRISRGSSPDIAPVIDRGAPQTARDLASRKTGKRHSPTEASIVRGLLASRGVLQPSTDIIAEQIELKAQILEAILEGCSGTKKTKVVLMILAGICSVAASDEEARGLVKNIEAYSAQLEESLRPLSPDRCWGKGAVFILAMEKAKQIIRDR